MFKKRLLEQRLQVLSRQYPIISITGPRQSGKTTLVQHLFDTYKYISLESPELRSYAKEDPKGFLATYPGEVIFDEIQRVPDLFSYLQIAVDKDDSPGRFILTGSQNFLLSRNISQSLAGRCAVTHLLPFSLAELDSRRPFDFFNPRQDAGVQPRAELLSALFKGFYPRIHDKAMDAQEWLGNYYQTYIERDVREILSIGDIETFGRFIRLCAGRCGQVLNLSSLANDCGISHTTARRWVSILEASFIVFLARPYFENMSKRLIKAPKLYFHDTGLLCYLLRIRSAEELVLHASRGSIFESFVIADIVKNAVHQAPMPPIHFWRDSTGHEIDLILEASDSLLPIEIKSAATIQPDYFKNILYWKALVKNKTVKPFLVYGGDEAVEYKGTMVVPWWQL
jgi:predicted AAA+ superfamily ATPase